MIKEGSLSLSTETRIIRFADSLTGMLGYEAEEVVGREYGALFPPETRAENMALIEEVKKAFTVSGHRTRMLRKDGSLADIYVSVYPLRDNTGSLYSFLLTVSTQELTSVPAILTDEFQRIFRCSNDAVAITDKSGNIIDVNNTFLETYGYTRQEVLGRNPRILKSSHSTKELYDRMWRDILDPEKGFWRGEIINMAKSGKEVPILLSINAIKDSRGEIKNFLGIAFNMSKQKELDRLNKMYIDYIIHDIRNPLTSINVNAEVLLLQLRESLPEKTLRKLETILLCAQKINAMTADILDYSRAQGKSLVIKKEAVDMRKILKDAVLPFEKSDKKLFVNGCAYTGDLDFETPITADPDKLMRIIYNLLSNAFKNAASEVRLSLRAACGSLELAVSDDGKGFSAEDAERVFDAFYQTEEGIRTGGAGLGLSIVKSFAEAHGGSVKAESGQGRGATFVVRLPVAAGAQSLR